MNEPLAAYCLICCRIGAKSWGWPPDLMVKVNEVFRLLERRLHVIKHATWSTRFKQHDYTDFGWAGTHWAIEGDLNGFFLFIIQWAML